MWAKELTYMRATDTDSGTACPVTSSIVRLSTHSAVSWNISFLLFLFKEKLIGSDREKLGLGLGLGIGLWLGSDLRSDQIGDLNLTPCSLYYTLDFVVCLLCFCAFYCSFKLYHFMLHTCDWRLFIKGNLTWISLHHTVTVCNQSVTCGWFGYTWTGKCPQYLLELITFNDGDSGRRCLCSTTSPAAIVQRTRTQLGHRAFSVCSPTIWNSLPKTLRLTDNYQHFRRLLKTHLFNLAFN